MKSYTVTETHDGRRVDKVIRQFFPDMPMGAIFKALRTGKIKVNKKKVKPEVKLQEGDEIRFFLRQDDIAQTAPKDEKEQFEKLRNSPFYKKNLSVLYEDSDLLILNKPAGVAVHPGSKHRHGRTMTDIAQAYTAGKTKDFQTTLVHRLDLDTSGVLVFAKNAKALRFMNKQMQEHTTEKMYYALCKGSIKKDKGTIKVALERTEGKSKSTKIIISKGGKDAKMSVTHYEVLERFGDLATLIQVRLETGRMHQIRVHMKSQGHSLWGDEHYGDFKFNKEIAKEPYKLKRMFLHAFSLSFTHPSTQKTLKVEAPLASELKYTLGKLK